MTAGEADRSRVAYVELPDGTPVWARISQADELELPDGAPLYTDAGFAGRAGERVQAQVAGLGGLITGVARSVAQGLRAVRPDEVSVEFGIELTGKAGKVVGLLADGEAKAALTVTLTWQNGGYAELGRRSPAGKNVRRLLREEYGRMTVNKFAHTPHPQIPGGAGRPFHASETAGQHTPWGTCYLEPYTP
ncbi:CU044_2847 family protein, partial [Streptomyces albidoflavus]|uniref:CU044_2847 family protein n=1 Tax=Streptomyces albidoflavus TaxID=1886 RepID=UPI00211BC4E2